MNLVALMPLGLLYYCIVRWGFENYTNIPRILELFPIAPNPCTTAIVRCKTQTSDFTKNTKPLKTPLVERIDSDELYIKGILKEEMDDEFLILSKLRVTHEE